MSQISTIVFKRMFFISLLAPMNFTLCRKSHWCSAWANRARWVQHMSHPELCWQFLQRSRQAVEQCWRLRQEPSAIMVKSHFSLATEGFKTRPVVDITDVQCWLCVAQKPDDGVFLMGKKIQTFLFFVFFATMRSKWLLSICADDPPDEVMLHWDLLALTLLWFFYGSLTSRASWDNCYCVHIDHQSLAVPVKLMNLGIKAALPFFCPRPVMTALQDMWCSLNMVCINCYLSSFTP